MPITGKYSEYYTNYKGEIIKRLPESELPKLAPGMKDPYCSRNMTMREKYNENRRIARFIQAKNEREALKENSHLK